MAGVGKNGKVFTVRDCSWVLGKFENLATSGFDTFADCTSDRTYGLPDNYNCIAWAAGKTNEWWWPWDIGGYSWPKGDGLCFESPHQETVPNFVLAFKSEGYSECNDGDYEIGFEKVAIYANHRGTPTHAARSLPSGVWTSKLGAYEDIQHATAQAIGGKSYGQPVAYLKRKVQNA